MPKRWEYWAAALLCIAIKVSGALDHRIPLIGFSVGLGGVVGVLWIVTRLLHQKRQEQLRANSWALAVADYERKVRETCHGH